MDGELDGRYMDVMTLMVGAENNVSRSERPLSRAPRFAALVPKGHKYIHVRRICIVNLWPPPPERDQIVYMVSDF